MTNIYDRIVAFSERNPVDYYYDRRVTDEGATLVADNMMRQLAEDPNFEKKFELLEKQDISVGVEADPGNSTKNWSYWRTEFSPQDFGRDGFSVTEQSLGYMADMHLHNANASLKYMDGLDEMAERNYLESALFVKAAQEAGIPVNGTLQQADFIGNHKIENGQVVQLTMDEILDLGNDPHPSVREFMQPSAGMAPAAPLPAAPGLGG